MIPNFPCKFPKQAWWSLTPGPAPPFPGQGLRDPGARVGVGCSRGPFSWVSQTYLGLFLQEARPVVQARPRPLLSTITARCP